MSIQWFPGHMAKAKRLISENLALIDVVLETIDARAPFSSSNDDLLKIFNNKTCVKIMTKSDLASPDATNKWLNSYKSKNIPAFAVDSLHRNGLDEIKSFLKLEHEKISLELAKKGRRPRALRILVAGIPNAGKSSLINALVKKDVAKTADVPGFTRGQQWIRVAKDIELLDTPGIMPPKFDSEEEGKTLAAIGCIKAEVFSEEDVAFWLIKKINDIIPDAIAEKYNLVNEEQLDILEIIAKKIGAINKGNIPDLSKAARNVLKEFQSGKLGRITLELPKEE